MVFLYGENGVGKTTLLKTILGLVSYQKGNILIHKRNLKELSFQDRAKYMAYVSQNKVPIYATCFEFILTGFSNTMNVFDVPSSKHKEKCETMMKKMHIWHLKDKIVEELSGGERQLIYIARAFVQDTKIIILDEPCAYLDFEKQHTILKMLKEYANHEKLIFITTHDPNLALTYADRILVMDQGKLCANIETTNNNYKNQFLQELNTIYGNHFGISEDKFIYYKEDVK